MARGRSTVADLMKHTTLPFNLVKDALLILIQHNLVHFREDKVLARRSSISL